MWMIACLGPHRQSVIERLLLLGEFLIRVSTASFDCMFAQLPLRSAHCLGSILHARVLSCEVMSQMVH